MPPHDFIEEPFAERRAAHTDDERDRARARLRVAKDRWDREHPAYMALVRERREAVQAAVNVGMSLSEIAEVYGLSKSNISRLNARAQGHDPNAKMKADRKRKTDDVESS